MKNSDSLKNPTKEEVSTAITRYNFVLKIFEEIIYKLKEANIDNNNWFIYSEKIGEKYLRQAYTLQDIFSNDIFINENGIQKKIIDLSSVIALLRVQFETYSACFHLFFDTCEMEEKIIRFRLWELDGLKTRQKFKKPDDAFYVQKIEDEKIEIDKCISIIKQFNYFKCIFRFILTTHSD